MPANRGASRVAGMGRVDLGSVEPAGERAGECVTRRVDWVGECVGECVGRVDGS